MEILKEVLKRYFLNYLLIVGELEKNVKLILI